ncbi:MAG: MinD/ParA family protein [Defluviitaleaceae bacterium]|nr:MinD/ParA family protein [Defluviitaleaceae bacterium]
MDQAERLRNLVRKQRTEAIAEAVKANMRVIAVTSGKGGVGKTNFTINLAINLARAKKRVVIIDADFGLANVELLFGVTPKYSFREILKGEKTVVDALTKGPEGTMFLSGGSGLTQLGNVTETQISLLINGFTKLDDFTDILLIDTGAGVSKNVTSFLKAAHEIIVVTTSDPTAIADAYTIIKTLAEGNAEPSPLKIVVNRVENHKEGLEVFNRLSRVCTRFLNVKPFNLGIIPYDKQLTRAVKAQEPVAIAYPDSESSKSIEAISRRLLNEPDIAPVGIGKFIEKWLGFMKK